MNCKTCGEPLADGAKFCGKCGAVVSEAAGDSRVEQPPGDMANRLKSYAAKAGEAFQPQSEPQEQLMPTSSYSSKVFVEPDEQLQGTLGNGYLENLTLLGRRMKSCRALLTDRRIYFQGRLLTGQGKDLRHDICERIVDVEDITGTGFVYSKPLGILASIIKLLVSVLAMLLSNGFGIIRHFNNYEYVLSLMGIVVAILWIVISYLINRWTLFAIEYAGGIIKFDAQIIGLSAVRDFQKQIRRAKDHAREKR